MHVRSKRLQAHSFPVRRVILWLNVAILGVVAVVAIAISNRSVAPISESAPPFNALSVGDPAPVFSAVTTQGPFSLQSTHRPVFLEVFATWCPHCQRETVILNQLYEKYHDRVAFVAVTGSPYAHDRASPESMADVLGFAQYFKVRYPIAFDGSLTVANKYLQGGFPTIAIIGTGKKIAYLGSGEVAETDLDSAIRHTLRR